MLDASYKKAKQLCYNLLNQCDSAHRCSEYDKLPPWFVDFYKEVYQCTQEVLKSYPELQTRLEESKTHPVGTKLSWLSQQMEKECLDTLRKAVVKSGRDVGALINDRLFVERLVPGDQTPLDSPLLKEWESFILEETGYHIELVEKPL